MNVFNIVARLMIFASLQVILFGCGSGGGDGTPTASKTRALQTGDSWIYEYEIGFQFAGIITRNVTRETLNGESVLAITDAMNLNFNGSNTSGVAISYMQQDTATGDIMAYGNKNGDDPVVTITDRPLPVAWPGIWEAGKTVAMNYHLSDGTTEQVSYTIIGQESVTTPAGTFLAWKCTSTGSPNSMSLWFVPELGNYVRIDVNSPSYTVRLMLRSTNVAGS